MHFFEIYSDIGAGKQGTTQGVQMLSEYCQQRHIGTPTTKIYNDGNSSSITYKKAKYIEILTEFFENKLLPTLTDRLTIADVAGQFPIVISGDHSNALGNLSAFLQHHQDKKVAVVWIDAHADMHSVYTTPSGNLHGMPLAGAMKQDNLTHAINEVDDAVVGYWHRLKNLHSNHHGLGANAVFFLGLRSYEPPEAALIKTHKMFAYSPKAHRNTGFEQVLIDLKTHLAEFDAVYISFDVDALDNSLIAATGTPESSGYTQDEMHTILQNLLALPNAALFEITEFNPTLDDDEKKYQVVFELFDDAVQTIAARK